MPIKKYVLTRLFRNLWPVLFVVIVGAELSISYFKRWDTTRHLQSTADTLAISITEDLEIGNTWNLKKSLGSFVDSGLLSSVWVRDGEVEILRVPFKPKDFVDSTKSENVFYKQIDSKQTNKSWTLGVEVKDGNYVDLLARVLVYFFSLVFIGISFALSYIISNSLSSELLGLEKTIKSLEIGATPVPTETIFKTVEGKLISERILDLHRRICEFVRVKQNHDRLKIVSSISRQVAHDIRSPLSALNMISSTLGEVSEQKRITIRESIKRINDIANNLLEQSRENPLESRHSPIEDVKRNKVFGDTGDRPPGQYLTQPLGELSITLLAPIVDSLVSEKRMQFRDKLGIEIDSNILQAYGLFANVNSVELKRVLSNLINNSVESLLEEKGHISIELSLSQNGINLVVRDNGKGIPSEILSKLGESEISYGKENSESGSGLGVFHAKSTVNSFGGTFKIDSTIGKGTEVTMTFPKATAPLWFVEKIELAAGSKVVSLDDDLTIHQIWKSRLSSLGSVDQGIEHFTFSTGEDLTTFLKNLKAQEDPRSTDISEILFLIDYELIGQEESGLDVIERLGLQSTSILVTSRYEESNIRERCARLKIKLIPKGMAGFVPISFQKGTLCPDLILIDDDPLIRLTWQIAAKGKGKTLLSFASYDEFLASADNLSRSCSIYIDVDLGGGERGELVAEKISYLGFLNINLATGYLADDLVIPSVVNQVIGKDFPL